MYLQKLSVLNFKNIREATVEFSPRLNCLSGRNGQGKTNFLDAVYYLSFCKSHSCPIDSQNLLHGADFMMLQGQYVDGERQTEFYCGLKPRQKKVFKHDKKAYERLSDHIGQMPLVMVSPADEELIREGSEERRRFMDMAISQYDKPYMQALVAYNEALKQRNALLRDDAERHFDDSLYEIYEEPMSEAAALIYRLRTDFINAFIPVFQRYYQDISGGQESVGMEYRSQLEAGPLLDQLREKRWRDKVIGYTTHGIHKDDLDITLDGFPIKREGSQGQNKTCLIAMKLAQYDFLQQATHRQPILLLDDLFDKLDSTRVDRIVSVVSRSNFGQTFITDTHSDHFRQALLQSGLPHKMFHIENGEIDLIDTDSSHG